MILKTGVKIQGIRNELLYALNVADKIYSSFGEELVITSLVDGGHGVGSFHYNGLAADLRTRYFDRPTQERVHLRLIKSLGNDYDVILEPDHIHLEFQPKTL